MTTAEVRAVTDTPGRIGPGATALLIAAPLIMAFARVFLVPYDADDWAATLTDMAAHQGRSDFGWILAVAASGLLGVTAAILSRELLAHRKKSGVFAVVATALGWAACASFGLGGLLMSEMAKAPDRAEQVKILTAFNSGNSVYIGGLLTLIGGIGYAVLAVGLARAKVVSRGAGVLIGLGGAATIFTMQGPLTPLLVATALILAVGHGFAIRPRGAWPR